MELLDNFHVRELLKTTECKIVSMKSRYLKGTGSSL